MHPKGVILVTDDVRPAKELSCSPFQYRKASLYTSFISKHKKEINIPVEY